MITIISLEGHGEIVSRLIAEQVNHYKLKWCKNSACKIHNEREKAIYSVFFAVLLMLKKGENY